MWDEYNTRKPILLLQLPGWLLLRVAERALFGLLFQESPRTTRASSQGTPQNSILLLKYACLRYEVPIKNRVRRYAAHSEQQPSAAVFSVAVSSYPSMRDEHNTRNPTLLKR